MKQRGFTVIEVIIVIVVMGLLMGIVAFNYGPWQQRVAENVLKSDLTHLASAMQTEANFSNTYPTTVPGTFSPSDDVTVTVVSATASTFCAEAEKTVGGVTHIWHIEESGDPVTGAC